MKIAFSGPHRTGKTTLGISLSEINPRYKFNQIEIAKAPVWDNYKSNLSSKFSFSDRSKIQPELMSYIESKIRGIPGNSILDRTPFDILAYFMTSIDETCDDSFIDLFETLKNNAIRVSNELIDVIITIPPGIDFVEDIGKKREFPYSSRIYQELLYSVILSELNQNFRGILIHVPRNFLSLDARISFCKKRLDWQ